MPVATPDTYKAMLDAARRGRYALPAIDNKKIDDPRTCMKTAWTSMANRVVRACAGLKSTGTSLGTAG